MPDRELPKSIRRQLSAALDSGAPLIAALPSQARFASRPAAMPAPRWRLRALTVAVAAVGIAVVAFAGPPQPRQWIVQSVNGISKQVGIPAGSTSPSPSHSESSSGGQGLSHESPEAGESPGAAESPEANESPAPSQSPEQEHGQPTASPTAEPSDDGGGGDDHSPEPSPSSDG